MATRKPLYLDPSGRRMTIAAPDTIDPSILPTSGSSSLPSDVASGSTYTVAAGSQQVATGPITIEGTLVVAGNLRVV